MGSGTTAEVVLRCRGLTKSFGGDRILDGIDLELHAGEVVLLRGENGTGKTTLVNILTGNLEPDKGTITISLNGLSKEFHFPRPWWAAFHPRAQFTPERLARLGIGRSWQDNRLFASQDLVNNLAVASPEQPGESLFRTIFLPWQVIPAERTHQASCAALLQRVGLTTREHSSVEAISLGQCKRVSILRSVQAGSRVLFLDEPLAALDHDGITQVLAFLAELAQRQAMSLVIAEHALNIPWVLNLATTVWTLAGGKVTAADAAQVRAEAAAKLDGSLERWLAGLAGPGDRLTRRPLPRSAVLTILQRGAAAGDPVVEVSDLVADRGRRRVIGWTGPDGQEQGLTFALRRGDIALLEAPNGWGKSTLLQVLAGLLPPRQGRVQIGGREIKTAHGRARAGLALLRDRDNLFEGLNVGENLALAGRPRGLATVPLRRLVSSLSGGQKQRLAWDTVAAGPAQALLLDEPLTRLDEPTTHLVMRAIAGMNDRAVLVCVPYVHEAKPRK